MNFKEDVTCNLCKLILEEPVSLPCGCWICNSHVSIIMEYDNEIRCNSCEQLHKIPPDGFRINKTAKKLIDNEMYLSDEEKQVKSLIQTQYEEFIRNLNKKHCEEQVSAHFAKIKEKIQIQRDKFQKRIDEITADILLALASKQEQAFSEINRVFNMNDVIELEDNFKKVQREFRYPNLTLENMKELKIRQEFIYKNIKSKPNCTDRLLNEINKIDFNSNECSKLDKNFFGQLVLDQK